MIAYNNFEIHKYDSKLEEKNQKRESKLRERKAMARQGLIDKDAINDISVTEEGSVEENADKRKVFELLVDEKQKKALKQANYPYQKQVWDKEGHGFYNAENRAKYYEIMLKFLKENLNVK